MKLHTVFVTYNRLHLTKEAISSYLATVTVPYEVWVVDNRSEDGTQEYLADLLSQGVINGYLPLTRNKYPGYACNRGWEKSTADATHLQRADNDFVFLPGWCKEAEEHFADPSLGQLGLRTDEEEQYVSINTGGNCIIARPLFDAGLRYDEKPWTKYPAGWTEDSYFSPAVVKMGYRWERVRRPCIVPISVELPDDPYYQKSWGDRRIYL